MLIETETSPDHHSGTFVAAEPQETTHGNCIRSTTGTHRRADREVHRIADGQVPSDTFLWAAITAIGASATLQMMGKQSASVFVGQWAPTLLILGLYNKLVKQHGSDFTATAA